MTFPSRLHLRCSHRLLVAALMLVMAGWFSRAPAANSEPATLAPKSLLLGLARAGQRIVAVGDRGHVLLSDDQGRTWQQVIVPSNAMLTGVSFGDATHGWAVGHDGVILATADAGRTWHRQAKDEGIDTVFLSVYFRDATHGWAVGAYGKFLTTTDGGATWIAQSPSSLESHYNSINAGPGDSLYLTGESGLLLASTDGGEKWQALDVPYDGSLFGLLPVGQQDLLVYGLRGHVFASTDRGRSWTPRKSASEVLIMTGLQLKSGLVVLAGLGGNFQISRDQGRTFSAWKPTQYNGGVSALLETDDGALLVAGELGVARLTPPGGPAP